MKPSPHRCQNCQCTLPEDSNYCDNCGQKRIEALPSVGELFRDFLSNLLALDSKLLRTMSGLLFRPGHLTQAYLQGKRKGYYTPFKLFLFWLTAAFLLLSLLLRKLPTVEEVYNFEMVAYQTQLRSDLYQLLPDSTHAQVDSVLTRHRPN